MNVPAELVSRTTISSHLDRQYSPAQDHLVRFITVPPTRSITAAYDRKERRLGEWNHPAVRKHQDRRQGAARCRTFSAHETAHGKAIMRTRRKQRTAWSD